MAPGSRVRIRQHSSPGPWMVLCQLEKEVPPQTGERGGLWFSHSLLRGIGPLSAWTAAASPALLAWRPGSLGTRPLPGAPGGWRPASWGRVLDGPEVACSQSSPAIPHSLGLCQGCTGASVLSPERHRWDFLSGFPGAEPHPHSRATSCLPFRRAASRGPTWGAAHSWLRLCAQISPPGADLSLLLTHVAEACDGDTGTTPGQFTPSSRELMRTGC